MGCGLRKIRQTDDSSPGKIYSTLKRPQVETKTGVAYTYCHLDFLVGKEDGTSTLCLSSVRELPSQLQDLYQQGFVLTVVHPFVHPCGQEPASIQQQLYRVVLTKLPDSSEKSHSDFEPYHLKLEECLSADHIPTAEHIQGYVKKIQDAADQGITFAGFIQEPAGLRPRAVARAARGEPSLSLHSSPSSLRSSELTASPSHHGEPDAAGDDGPEDWGSSAGKMETEEGSERTAGDVVSDNTSAALTLESFEGREEESPSHNHSKAKDLELSNRATKPSLTKSGAELFGLFNYPSRRRGPLKYYTVKVPLRVQAQEAGMAAVEADWLDHMTQHFNGGASLVDGYFHLDKDNGQPPKVTEGVFVFQEGDPSTNTAYDALVVEQWSIVDGVQVKTDYIPLLQSLASFGWRLTCVLPTPIVKTNSDGSLSTKQIVFLQRPALPVKKKQTKKLIFRTRNKSGKNSVKDAPKNKKKKNTTTEKELEDPKLQDGVEKAESTIEMKGTSEEQSGKSGGEVIQKEAGEVEDMSEGRSEGNGGVEAETRRDGGEKAEGERREEQESTGDTDSPGAEVKDGEMESEVVEESDLNTESQSPQTCRQQDGVDGQTRSANDGSGEGPHESSSAADQLAPAADGSLANQE